MARTDQAARILRELKNRPGHSSSLACGYGAHDFERDKPYLGYKQCRACEAAYIVDLEVAMGDA